MASIPCACNLRDNPPGVDNPPDVDNSPGVSSSSNAFVNCAFLSFLFHVLSRPSDKGSCVTGLESLRTCPRCPVNAQDTSSTGFLAPTGLWLFPSESNTLSWKCYSSVPPHTYPLRAWCLYFFCCCSGIGFVPPSSSRPLHRLIGLAEQRSCISPISFLGCFWCN